MMTEFEVRPGEGVGPVRLGMTPEEVRAAMPAGWESFKTSPDAAHETDAWFEAGFQVLYEGVSPTVASIKLSRDSGFGVRCFGVDIFQTPAERVANKISDRAALDIDDPALGCSYRFPSLDLVLWRPFEPESDNDEEARYFSTIAIGRPGYFDS